MGLGVAALLARPAAGQEHGDGLLPPGDWTEEQRHHLLDLIDRTEAELPAFAAVDDAVAQGFRNFGATAPGGYDHYMNQAWIDDEHILDPRFPESLVYRITWDPESEAPEHELVAAMFFLPSGTEMPDIPAEYAWMPGWHVHPDICVNDDMTFAGLASGGVCSRGRPLVGPPMSHVWIAEYECDHRFGEVDISGVECDLSHGHEPDPHEPDPHEPGPDPHEPDPHEPGTHSPGTTGPHGGHDDPGPDGGGGGGGHDDPTGPPAARPVRGQPNYTG